MKIEHIILKNLFKNDQYVRKVLPHLKDSYFNEISEKKLFNILIDYINKYNNIPSYESLIITLENLLLENKLYEAIKSLIIELNSNSEISELEWLLD